MIKIRKTDKKVTNSKLNISAQNVQIINGQFQDEDGSIIPTIQEALPSGAVFTVKITVELDDDEDSED